MSPFKSVATLANEIKELAERISAIELRLTNLETPPPKEESPVVSEEKPIEPVGIPMPSEYRNVVNEVLNQSFEIEISYATDLPQFTFTIIVPDKYRTPAEIAAVNIDRRPRAISNALGLQGVRDWTNLVFTSFGPTIQSLIVADRINA